MQHESDLLDDLDFSNDDEQKPTGTWLQILRAFGLGTIISFGLWLIFFKLIRTSPFDDIASFDIIRIRILNYRLEFVQIMAWTTILLNAIAFLLIARCGKQPLQRIILACIPYSILAMLILLIIASEGRLDRMLRNLVGDFEITLFLTGVIFLLTNAVLFVLRKKHIYIALPLLIASLFLLGFIR